MTTSIKTLILKMDDGKKISIDITFLIRDYHCRDIYSVTVEEHEMTKENYNEN